MSSPAKRFDYSISKEDFTAKVDQIVTGFRALIKVGTDVYDNEGRKTQVSRKEYRTMVSRFAGELENLGKHGRASIGKVKKAVRKEGDARPGEQLRQVFVISDQLVSYLRQATLGNNWVPAISGYDADVAAGLGAMTDLKTFEAELVKQGGSLAEIPDLLQVAEDNLVAVENKKAEKKGDKPRDPRDVRTLTFPVSDYLDLVLNKRIATSGILISLLSLINTVGDMHSKSNGQRIHYDSAMANLLDGKTNTRWVVDGKDLTPKESELKQLQFKDSAARAKFMENYRHVNESSFARLRDHDDVKTRRPGNKWDQVTAFKDYPGDKEAERDDDWGMLQSMIMVVISHARVPNEVLRFYNSPLLDQVESRKQPSGQNNKAGKPIMSETNMKVTENLDTADGIQAQLHYILHAGWHVINEPAKKVVRDSKRRDQAKIKKAQTPKKPTKAELKAAATAKLKANAAGAPVKAGVPPPPPSSAS
jgi:hypothetical protein